MTHHNIATNIMTVRPTLHNGHNHRDSRNLTPLI